MVSTPHKDFLHILRTSDYDVCLRYKHVRVPAIFISLFLIEDAGARLLCFHLTSVYGCLVKVERTDAT